MTPALLLSVLILSPVPGSDDAETGLPGPAPPDPGISDRASGQEVPDSLDSRETGDGQEELVVIRRSPTGALLRSAFVPGWGQLYNREPLKGAVLFVVETGLLAWLVREHIEAEDARKDFLETGDPLDESRYERHSQRRLDLIWYTSAAWLYGMLDAYVDAYLFSFETENRRFERDTGIGAAVYVRF